MPDIFILIPMILLVVIGLASIFINEEDLIGVQFIAFLSLLILPIVGFIYSSM